MATSTTLIERREYKYLIDHATAARVRAAIQPFCELDEHAATSPTHTYTVETLYLDTPALSLFWANDHEQLDRVKVRVRQYADAPDAPVFLEVKRRVNDVISKSRGRVPRELWAQLVADRGAAIPATIPGRERAAVERFLAIGRASHLQPYTLVRYAREPYVSRVDHYARVTFDTRIRAHAHRELSFTPHGQGWRALDDAVTQRAIDTSMIVLELKFTSQVPLWMVHVVRSCGLVRGAFSKYGTSIRAFYETVDWRTSRNAGGWP